MFAIRAMRPEDYAAVYALWRESQGVGLRALDDSEPRIAYFLQRNPDTCFVAEDEGALVGVILAGQDGRRGFIYHTCVKPARRCAGIGTALARRVQDAMRDMGILKLALVAYERNERGNAFWERMGFTTRPDLTYRDCSLNDANVNL